MMRYFIVQIYKNGWRLSYEAIAQHPADLHDAALVRFFPCNVYVYPMTKKALKK